MEKKSVITEILKDAASLKEKISKDPSFIESIERVASCLLTSIRQGGTIYLCGNGGSSADAMHFTEELVARFKRERPGIRAMHFMDAATLTCWGNDYGYSTAFERQAQTFCSEKDVLIGISTSGNSENILLAINAAKKLGCKTVAFLGRDGGKIKNHTDFNIIVPHQATERIQEIHIVVVHILCELIETSE